MIELVAGGSPKAAAKGLRPLRSTMLAEYSDPAASSPMASVAFSTAQSRLEADIVVQS